MKNLIINFIKNLFILKSKRVTYILGTLFFPYTVHIFLYTTFERELVLNANSKKRVWNFLAYITLHFFFGATYLAFYYVFYVKALEYGSISNFWIFYFPTFCFFQFLLVNELISRRSKKENTFKNPNGKIIPTNKPFKS